MNDKVITHIIENSKKLLNCGQTFSQYDYYSLSFNLLPLTNIFVALYLPACELSVFCYVLVCN